MDKINTRKGSGLDSEPQRHGELAFISDDSIMHEFVTPQMMAYFGAKLPNVKLNTLTHRICELLKYLILTPFSPGRILFGTDVDDVWHYWILQTRQYAQLCEKLPGGTFRHHSSADYVEAKDATEVSTADAMQRILSFFISYYLNFGPITKDQLECWPTLQWVAQEAGWNLDDLNNFLHDQVITTSRERSGSSITFSDHTST
jgi:hypothetical protein